MPALKRKTGQLPKAVQELKECIATEGQELTAAAVEGAPRAVRQRAFSSLNYVLKSDFPDKWEECRKLTEDDLRREWMSSFVLDPASGGSVAFSRTERTERVENNTIEVWLTESECGGPKYLNNLDHAKIAVTTCEWRYHSSNKALHDAKVKEYKVRVSWDLYQKAKQDTVGVEQKAEIGNDDAAAVSEALRSNAHGVPKRRARAGDEEESRRRGGSGGRRGSGGSAGGEDERKKGRIRRPREGPANCLFCRLGFAKLGIPLSKVWGREPEGAFFGPIGHFRFRRL
eukprot:9487327-Pyramimonas_sp.AAC.1